MNEALIYLYKTHSSTENSTLPDASEEWFNNYFSLSFVYWFIKKCIMWTHAEAWHVDVNVFFALLLSFRCDLVEQVEISPRVLQIQEWEQKKSFSETCSVIMLPSSHVSKILFMSWEHMNVLMVSLLETHSRTQHHYPPALNRKQSEDIFALKADIKSLIIRHLKIISISHEKQSVQSTGGVLSWAWHMKKIFWKIYIFK